MLTSSMKGCVFLSYPVRPNGPVDVILDTDTYNEIDDQFAIAYMLSAPERLHVRAICAAPFHNEKSIGPADGMEKSYQEILKILRLAQCEKLRPLVYRGSERYLPNENTPVDSPAARAIAEIAKEYSPDKPLYIIAIGAITNVASALLFAPEIAQRVVIVWLGGNALHWPHNHEFNMSQDVAAARVIFGGTAPLVQLPCFGVVNEARVTGPELSHWLRGHNELCDYLYEHTVEEAETYAAGTAWSRVIWDVTAIAWLLDTDGKIICDRPEHSPIPQYDDRYSFDPERPLIRYVWRVDRDALFTDLFIRLSRL